ARSTMSRHGIIAIRPTRFDLAAARASAHLASPREQRALRVVTLLADEKAVLALAGAVWVASRLMRRGPDEREADRLLASVAVAGALPHVFKYVFDRRRPDR